MKRSILALTLLNLAFTTYSALGNPDLDKILERNFNRRRRAKLLQKKDFRPSFELRRNSENSEVERV